MTVDANSLRYLPRRSSKNFYLQFANTTLTDRFNRIIQCFVSSQMKLYEDFAKSRVKKSMDESLSEGERSSKVAKAARTAKTKKETGAVCTHVFQVRVVYSLQSIVSVMRHHMIGQLKTGHNDCLFTLQSLHFSSAKLIYMDHIEYNFLLS